MVAQMVKNLPIVQETWVRSLGWEDPLEKEMATHSSILAWKIPWMEENDWKSGVGEILTVLNRMVKDGLILKVRFTQTLDRGQAVR